MRRSVVESNIEEIARMLVERRKRGKQPVLFLGARAGGLFRNKILYDTLKQFSLLNFDGLSDSEQFQECYTILTNKSFSERDKGFSEREQHDVLVGALGPLAYREEDRLLSGLVKAGFFKSIITTNIDTMLEDAYEAWGLHKGKDYRTYIAGESNVAELQGDKPPYGDIIKVLGDLNELDYRIGASDFALKTEQSIKDVLQNKLSEEVLVVGYDSFWDRGIEQAFPMVGEPVWYVSSNEKLSDKDHLPEAFDHTSEKSLLRERGNYSDFLRTIYMFLAEDISSESREPMLPLTVSQSASKGHKGVFITCSYEDRRYLERLKVHLKGYLLTEDEKSIQEIMHIWDDREISAGKAWSQDISAALAQAKVVVVLVSNHFLSSNALQNQELSRVVEAADRGEVELFPVILDAPKSAFDKDRNPLYRYQKINGVPAPLSRQKPYEQEVLWDKLARQVFTILGSS